MMSTLDTLVRLDDPDFYLGDPVPVYRRLRQEAPMYWHREIGFWVASKFADVRAISTNPEFSSASGILINDVKYGGGVLESFFPDGGKSIILYDPPRHRMIRGLVSPAFTPKVIAGLETRIRAKANELLDRIPKGEPFDFVSKIAMPLPTMVLAELLGLHDDNVDVLSHWVDVATGSASPGDQGALSDIAAEWPAMFEYFNAQLERQRRDPRPGLISTLLDSEFEGERITPEMLLMFCVTLLPAGSETTRNTMAGELHSLVQHPDQLRLLQERPELAASAAEETLRWFSTVSGFMRRAKQDIRVRDQVVKAGEYCYMLYAAANRDEEVFERPDEFDITRPNAGRHLTFGYGEHWCLGSNLARLELRILFEEIIGRFRNFQFAGEPVPQRSTMGRGFLSLPVTFS